MKITSISVLILAALLCFSACEKAENESEETEVQETEGENSETEKEEENGPKTYEIKFESDFIRDTAELTISPDGTFELIGGYAVHVEKDDLELYENADFDTIEYFVKSKYSGTWTEEGGVYTLVNTENLYTYVYDPIIRNEMISYLDVLGTQSPGYYAEGEYEAYVNMEYISKEDAGTWDYKMIATVKVEGDEAIALNVKEFDKEDNTLLKEAVFEDGIPVTLTSYSRVNKNPHIIIYFQDGKRHRKDTHDSETGALLSSQRFDENGELIEE